MIPEDDSTSCKYANVCISSCRCGAKSKKDLDCWEEDKRSFWERGHDDGYLHTIYRYYREKERFER